MRYVLLFASLLLVCLAPAARAGTTGTVTVTGQVPTACNITVTPLAGASNIADISVGGTDLSIATVNENCNDVSGYTVGVAGTHSGTYTGKFVDSVSGDSQPFTIKYNGSTVPVGGQVTNVTVPGINQSRSVQISYAANPALTASAGFTYTETLTFTITAK